MPDSGNPPAYYRTTFTYSGVSALNRVRDFRGPSEETDDWFVLITYDTSDRVEKVELPKVIDYVISPTVKQRHDREYTYNAPSGGIYAVEVEDERNEVWTYSFDAGGRFQTIVDPLSQTLATAVWSTDNRLKCITNVLQGTTNSPTIPPAIRRPSRRRAAPGHSTTTPTTT